MLCYQANECFLVAKQRFTYEEGQVWITCLILTRQEVSSGQEVFLFLQITAAHTDPHRSFYLSEGYRSEKDGGKKTCLLL